MVIGSERAGHPLDGLQTEKALHRRKIPVAVQQCMTAFDTDPVGRTLTELRSPATWRGRNYPGDCARSCPELP
jgi:hypothetical protein